MQKDGFGMSDKMNIGTNKGINEGFQLKANMKLELFDSEGNRKDVREIHNSTTTASKNGVASQLLNTPDLPSPGWMEFGTGTPASTLLGAAITGSRIAVTSKTRNNNIITLVGDWSAGVGTGAITEAGIFDVATYNTVNMWCNSSFAVVNKGAGDSFRITWTLTFN